MTKVTACGARNLAQRQAKIAAKAWADTHPCKPGRKIVQCASLRQKIAGICLLVGLVLLPEGLITHHLDTIITASLAIFGATRYLRGKKIKTRYPRGRKIRT